MAQGVQKIPKVSARLRQNKDAYDPKAVSFGPYHHGEDELQQCEKAKTFSVQKFVDGSGKDEAFFYQKIMDVIADARNRYVEGSTDDKFAEMMLRDACFLIYLMQIDKRKTTKYDCSIYECTGQVVLSLAFRDIFLLENQIPFSILTLLINSRYGPEGEEALRRFLHRTIWGRKKQPNATHWMAEAFKEQLPLHLLEAFHIVFVGRDPAAGGKTREKKKENVNVNVDATDNRMSEAIFKPLHLLEGFFHGGKSRDNVYMQRYNIDEVRSAKDLKARGIHFKPSPTPSLKAINFVPGIFYGTLQLPTWFLTRTTKVVFPNMIAYELCPENNNVETTVVRYLDFMKKLIQTAGDVKELKESNILPTTLGSDTEVAKFFRDLKYEIELSDNFLEVREKVEQHYHSRRRTCMAQINRRYFGSPLAIIGWLAGLLLLLLTIVQTIFTILAYVRG